MKKRKYTKLEKNEIIIYTRVMTPWSLFKGMLCTITTFGMGWIKEVIYPEKEIVIKISKEDYLKFREEYQSIKVDWRLPNKKHWRIYRKNFFMESSRLPQEKKKLKHFADVDPSKPSLVINT